MTDFLKRFSRLLAICEQDKVSSSNLEELQTLLKTETPDTWSKTHGGIWGLQNKNTLLTAACKAGNFDIVKILIKGTVEIETQSGGVQPKRGATAAAAAAAEEIPEETATAPDETTSAVAPEATAPVAAPAPAPVAAPAPAAAKKAAAAPAAKKGAVPVKAMVKTMVAWSDEGSGVNANTSDGFGVTPIIYAIVNRDVKMAEFLVVSGANITNPIRYCVGNTCQIEAGDIPISLLGKNPLMLAVDGNDTDMVTLLLSKMGTAAKGSINYQRDTGLPADENKSMNTAIHFAVFNENAVILEKLCAVAGVDLSLRNKDGLFPLLACLKTTPHNRLTFQMILDKTTKLEDLQEAATVCMYDLKPFEFKLIMQKYATVSSLGSEYKTYVASLYGQWETLKKKMLYPKIDGLNVTEEEFQTALSTVKRALTSPRAVTITEMKGANKILMLVYVTNPERVAEFKELVDVMFYSQDELTIISLIKQFQTEINNSEEVVMAAVGGSRKTRKLRKYRNRKN
jgi:hypothetical protein